MQLRSLVGVCLPLLVASVVAGCNNSSSAPAPDSTATASAGVTAPAPVASASAAPDGKRGRRRDGADGPGHRHGPASPAARLVHEADELDLTDAQKATVEKLEKDLRPADAPGDRKAMHDELVAGIRAGKIDAAKLEAKSADAEKAMVARREKELEIVNALHAALKPEQRKALTAALRAKQAMREERGDKGEKDKGPPKGDPTGYATKRAERLTKQLELDAAQQKKVEALVAKDRPEASAPGAMEAMRDEAKKKMDAMLTAFEADIFDAKKLDAMPPPAPKGGKSRFARELSFMSELLPILKPDQREKLAASMERRMDRPGPGIGHNTTFFDD